MTQGESAPKASRRPAWSALKNAARWPIRHALRHVLRDRSVRHILFPCAYAHIVEFQRDLWEILRGDPRLRFHITLHSPETSLGQHEKIKNVLPLPVISGTLANVWPWDLVVVADHGFEELCAPWRYPVLRITHGVAGKNVHGGEYQYGKRCFNSDGRFRYTRMFETSQVNRDRIVASEPRLANHIAVVGSPQMDRVLTQAGRRDEFRRQLGFAPHEIVVFVTSTWGMYSLFQTMGDEIIAEARPLLGPFRFVLSAHPLDLRSWPYSKRIWGEYVRTLKPDGFDVREPADSWVPYMVASDIILTDHTSLAIYGASLGRPVVFVPLEDKRLVEGSALWELREMSPVLEDSRKLHETLLDARSNYPYDRLAALARNLNACPGHSVERIREETYRLLSLDPLPETAASNLAAPIQCIPPEEA